MFGDENTCRICFTTTDTLTSLFCKQQGLFICEKLTKLGIKAEVDDGRPSAICCDCLVQLDITLNFLDKCEKSNQILTNKLSRVVEFTEEIDSDKVIVNSEECSNSYLEGSLLDNNDKVSVKSVFDEELKSSVTFGLEDAQCSECGSKRRCCHWAPPTTHTCPYCQKVFTRKFNFKLHIKRHVGVREWWCAVCGSRAVSRSLAARHCEPRPRARCPQPGCTRTYTTNTNLLIHLRTHTGERPFECSECGKRFTSKNTLKDHIRIHTGALPYICPVCGKRFRTNKLSTHMSTHGQGPRYGCKRDGCATRFSTRRALLRHERTHSGVLMAAPTDAAHGCTVCPARYRHKQSLNKHVKKQHSQV